MAATIIVEKTESRRVGVNGQGEDREKIWIVETNDGPPDALTAAGIPAINDTWPAEADMVCISVESRYSYKSDVYIYCEVTAQYSDYRQNQLQNPGDMTIAIEMAAGTETVRYAPRITNENNNSGGYTYLGTNQTYATAERHPVGQFGESGAPAYRPRYTIRITKLLDNIMANEIYEFYYSLQGMTNDAEWNGAARGVVLFLGGELVKIGRDRWTASMTFIYDPDRHFYKWYVENQQDRSVSDLISSQTQDTDDFTPLNIDLSGIFEE